MAKATVQEVTQDGPLLSNGAGRLDASMGFLLHTTVLMTCWVWPEAEGNPLMLPMSANGLATLELCASLLSMSTAQSVASCGWNQILPSAAFQR
jgi:hypothetical protein